VFVTITAWYTYGLEQSENFRIFTVAYLKKTFFKKKAQIKADPHL
jgi:hypothetical protein